MYFDWKLLFEWHKSRLVWIATPFCLMSIIWKVGNNWTFNTIDLSTLELKNLFLRTLYDWMSAYCDVCISSSFYCTIFRIVISHEFSFVIFKSTTCMLLWFNSIIKYNIEKERERERESLCLYLNYFH